MFVQQSSRSGLGSLLMGALPEIAVPMSVRAYEQRSRE